MIKLHPSFAEKQSPYEEDQKQPSPETAKRKQIFKNSQDMQKYFWIIESQSKKLQSEDNSISEDIMTMILYKCPIKFCISDIIHLPYQVNMSSHVVSRRGFKRLVWKEEPPQKIKRNRYTIVNLMSQLALMHLLKPSAKEYLESLINSNREVVWKNEQDAVETNKDSGHTETKSQSYQ